MRRTWVKSSVSLFGALLLVSTGVAIGAFYQVVRNIPATVALVEVVSLPEGALGVYSDAALTQPVTSLNFGQVTPPELLPPFLQGLFKPPSLPVFLKNGTADKQLLIELSSNFPRGSVGLVAGDGSALTEAQRLLNPGQVLGPG